MNPCNFLGQSGKKGQWVTGWQLKTRRGTSKQSKGGGRRFAPDGHVVTGKKQREGEGGGVPVLGSGPERVLVRICDGRRGGKTLGKCG